MTDAEIDAVLREAERHAKKEDFQQARQDAVEKIGRMTRPEFAALVKAMGPALEDDEFDRIMAERQAAADAARAAEAIDKARRVFAALDIPDRWTLDTFDAANFPAFQDVADAVRTGDRSAILSGPTRSGKSHGAAALARMAAQAGRIVYRIEEPNLARLFAQYRGTRSSPLDEIFDRMTRADLLVYDDVGKSEIARGLALSDFGAFVFAAFDKRAEHRRRNIATTRYQTPAALAEAIGADMVRRILQDEPGHNGLFAAFEKK